MKLRRFENKIPEAAAPDLSCIHKNQADLDVIFAAEIRPPGKYAGDTLPQVVIFRTLIHCPYYTIIL